MISRAYCTAWSNRTKAHRVLQLPAFFDKQDCVSDSKYVAQIKITKPLFIIGPPRTASTFLLKLLSQDTAFRCPKFWEMVYPTPPPTKENYENDPRGAMAEGGLESFEVIVTDFLKKMRKFHYIGGNEVGLMRKHTCAHR